MSIDDNIQAELPKAPRRVIQETVRVRLLIAIPVVIVLLLTIMGGLLFQMVEFQFENVPGTSQTMEDFATQWLLLLIISDVFGAIVGYFIAHSITSPIKKLISISRKVAGGDFSDKAMVVQGNEVGQLGNSFNYMIDALSNYTSLRNKYIMESFSGGLITTDVNGAITTMNSAAEKILNVKAMHAIGKDARHVLAGGGMQPLLSIIEEALWRKHQVKSRRVEIGERGKPVLLSVNASPMRDDHDTVFGLAVNFRDLAEWERFYQQMGQADRLATIGTFATGLAHEIRNPLGAIKGTAQLLAEDVGNNSTAAEYIQVIIKEVNRLDLLVREVQDFSVTSTTHKQPTDLSALMRDILLLARNNRKTVLASDVEVVEEYQPLPETYLSQDRMTQALLNIVGNAFQATPDGGRISISTAYNPEEPLPLSVTVHNTGSTIDPDEIPLIFEPFYSTKASGTGLGLSIAYQIVKRHRGEVSLQNTENGVAFTVRLPLQTEDDEGTI